MRPWTLDEEAMVRRLWIKHSATEIGSAMGRSKASIISKAHKLELQPKAMTGIRRKGKPVPMQERPTKAAPRLALSKQPKSIRPVEIMPEAEPIPPARLCQYPYGDPRDPAFRFCEAPVKTGSPYCEYHHAICYVRKVDAA